MSLCSPDLFPVDFSPAALRRSRIVCLRPGTQHRLFGPILSPICSCRRFRRRGSDPGPPGSSLSHPCFQVCVVNMVMLPLRSESEQPDVGRPCVTVRAVSRLQSSGEVASPPACAFRPFLEWLKSSQRLTSPTFRPGESSQPSSQPDGGSLPVSAGA